MLVSVPREHEKREKRTPAEGFVTVLDVEVDDAGDLGLLRRLVRVSRIHAAVHEPDGEEDEKEWCEAVNHEEGVGGFDEVVEFF